MITMLLHPCTVASFIVNPVVKPTHQESLAMVCRLSQGCDFPQGIVSGRLTEEVIARLFAFPRLLF